MWGQNLINIIIIQEQIKATLYLGSPLGLYRWASGCPLTLQTWRWTSCRIRTHLNPAHGTWRNPYSFGSWQIHRRSHSIEHRYGCSGIKVKQCKQNSTNIHQNLEVFTMPNNPWYHQPSHLKCIWLITKPKGVSNIFGNRFFLYDTY